MSIRTVKMTYMCKDCNGTFLLPFVVHYVKGYFRCIKCYYKDCKLRKEFSLEQEELMINPGAFNVNIV